MKLAKGVRLMVDRVRERSVLMGPERGLVLDAIADAVVRLIDGTRSVDDIVEALAPLAGSAPRDAVRRHVEDFLTALAARRMLA
jgi:coenzyme PQQ biosynthesis protein PqqD